MADWFGQTTSQAIEIAADTLCSISPPPQQPSHKKVKRTQQEQQEISNNDEQRTVYQRLCEGAGDSLRISSYATMISKNEVLRRQLIEKMDILLSEKKLTVTTKLHEQVTVGKFLLALWFNLRKKQKYAEPPLEHPYYDMVIEMDQLLAECRLSVTVKLSNRITVGKFLLNMWCSKRMAAPRLKN